MSSKPANPLEKSRPHASLNLTDAAQYSGFLKSAGGKEVRPVRYFRRWMAGPWFFFVLFASVKACLSYSPFSFGPAKLWAGFYFVSAFHFFTRPSTIRPHGARGPGAPIPDTIPSFRPWLWFILAALAA